jgi:amino acid adenylation domain-containing protein
MMTTHYPLSSPQLDIWFDQILYPNVPLYNTGGYTRIEGPIDPARFEKALNQVIAENDALRSILHEGDSLPTQTFAENVHLKLDFHDFSEQKNADELVIKWMQQEFVKPFQLYEHLLFQFALCKASERGYYWFKKYHHIIVDGWAISLIVQRVAAAYNALSTGQSGESKCYSYKNFIQNDQAYFESEKFVKAKRYWQDKYQQVPEPLFMRRSATHSQIITSQSSILRLKRSFYNQLNDFALKNKASTFHVILGALYCYFVRTFHREDFVIGLPTLNRNNAAFKQTVGLFAGTSPALFRFGTDLSVVELVEKIRQELQKDYRHQRFPLSEIHRQVGLHSHQQLFDIMLSYAKHNYDVDFNGSSSKTVYTTAGFEQNALAIYVEEFHQHDDVNIYFDYNLGFFDAEEIERLKARFEFLLGEFLRQPSVPVRLLQIMPTAELNKIRVEWNNTITDYPCDKTIVDLFEQQVAKTPNAIAVVFENQQLTYRELNLKANQLAHYLQQLGVKPDVLVGICLERSVEMVIGLLGILKAGGAYLPLDPAYPVARLAFMLADASVEVLLTQKSLKEGLPTTQAQVVCLDFDALSQSRSENPINELKPDNLAYVIYTSGSTGKPKGVAISHQGFINLVNWFVTDFNLTATDSVLVISSESFDLTQKNFFAPLIKGGQLHLLPAGYEPNKITQLVAAQHITWLNCTPSAFYPLIESSENRSFQKLASLRYVFLGGEPISLTRLWPWLQSTACQAVNTYGPTECSDVCAAYLLEQPERFLERAIPIGKPIFNTTLFILGKHLDLLPVGVVGELYIGGVGLARGYLNRPELTAEKFIKNPFDPHSRLYKTGDLARYLPDGNIEYLGRIDNQVKIRGFRIELGEIEAVLAQHPDVQEAVVIAREDEPRLVAYIVSDLIPTRIPYQSECLVKYDDHLVPVQTADICTAGALLEGSMSFEKGKDSLRDKLRHALKEKLPNYMVPSDFILLMSLPLTPSGKIDRRALSQLSVYHLSEKTFIAPRTPKEELLAGIWAEVLGVERVGVHDNFFDLGGHSLLAVKLMARIGQQFGKKLPLSTLIEGPTIEQLATVLNQSTEKMWSSLVAIQPNGTKRPFFCVPGIGGNVTDFYELALQLGNEQPFYGLQAVGLDGKSKPYTNIEDMATHYIMQTVQPQGPYLLGGHSFGALVAVSTITETET